MTIDVDMSQAMNGVTMKVEIRARRMWLLKLRVLVGVSLLRLSAAVLGCNMEVKTE